jgi:hypothetical protein
LDCWIAEDPVYVLVRNETEAIYDTQGRQISPKQRHVFAKFKRGGAPGWALRKGLETFEFRKMPERGVSKQQWLAYYDVKEDASQMGWTEEEQAAIVATLDGAGGHAALRIAPDKLAAPWPKYDSLKVQGQRTIEKVAEKIAETVLELGLDPASVVAYEQENLGRSEVVNALTALASTEVEEELVAN